MDGNDLLGFLIIGLIFVVADGQVLYRDGRRYLRGPDGGDGSGSLAWMVVTVFHLVAFGLLALLSVTGPAWSGSAPALIGRLGVFLLVLAVAHAVTISVLARRRQDSVAETRFPGSGRTAAGPLPRTTADTGSLPRTAGTTDSLSRTAADACLLPRAAGTTGSLPYTAADGESTPRADASRQPIVTPVPGQPGPHPHVSPDLGNNGPYRT